MYECVIKIFLQRILDVILTRSKRVPVVSFCHYSFLSFFLLCGHTRICLTLPFPATTTAAPTTTTAPGGSSSGAVGGGQTSCAVGDSVSAVWCQYDASDATKGRLKDGTIASMNATHVTVTWGDAGTNCRSMPRYMVWGRIFLYKIMQE